MRGLDGKRTLVTGAAGGIGLATAWRLVEEGARVALVDIDEPALAQAGELIGSSSLPLPADVSDEDQVASAVEAATAAWGGLDVIVPNAGVQLTDRDDR